ncbi:MAG: 3-oxoadipate enol-lactonase [Mycobacteriales bacterium]
MSEPAPRLLGHDVHGPADAPTLVLGSSVGTDRTMWDAALPRLAERFRVVRYDHRGHGRSPVPPGPYTIAGLADDLVGLLDALGIERAHLGGLSLGGMVAMQLAATRPERVDRLGLVSTSAHLPPASMWAERAATVRTAGPGALVDAVFARWFTPAGAGSAEALRLRQVFLAQPPEGYAGCCEAVGAMDLRSLLGRIAAPTLVLGAAADPATPPSHAEAIAAAIGGAELVVLPDAAHLAAVERSDSVADLLTRHFAGRAD